MNFSVAIDWLLNNVSSGVIGMIGGATGGLVTGILNRKYEIEKRKSIQVEKEKSEFFNDLESMIIRMQLSFQTYISDYNPGDQISYDHASNARHEVPDQDFIEYNTRKDAFASKQLQEKCDELTQICMQMKRLDIHPRSENDPLSVSKSKKVLGIMGEMNDLSTEVENLIDKEHRS